MTEGSSFRVVTMSPLRNVMIDMLHESWKRAGTHDIIPDRIDATFSLLCLEVRLFFSTTKIFEFHHVSKAPWCGWAHFKAACYT